MAFCAAACVDLITGGTPAPPPLVVAAAAPGDAAALRAQSFAARCAQPGVVRCVSFDTPEQVRDQSFAAVGEAQGRAPMGLILSGETRPAPGLDCAVAVDGCSLRFTIASNTGPGGAGSWYTSFADDLGTRFGAGEEFYVQWRQRFSRAYLETAYDGGGWKQAIIGEGDRPGYAPDGRVRWSCTQLELVVVNKGLAGFPQMYHSCGGKDEQYEPLPLYTAQPYHADEWMTFQVRVKIGTWYRNDRVYHADSTVELWVAREGAPSRRAVLAERYDLANDDPAAGYGKLWLLPYHTGKDPAQSHPVAYTWYDEVVISRNAIPDP
jgi:hypothetical protein